jgi:hypothetical protein
MALVQLRFSSDGRLALFPDEAHRRAAVHKLVKVAGGQLVMFGFVDHHGHPLVVTNDAGILKRVLGSTLGTVAAQPLEKLWSDVVRERRHALALVDYLINQPLKHGIPAHPATWTGSGFLDAVGARIIDGLALRLFEELRITKDHLLEMVGLPPGCLRPAPNDMVRALGAVRLKEAASAVFAADLDLKKNNVPSIRARRVVAVLAQIVGICVGDVAWALDVAEIAARRLAKREVDPAWLEAARIRLGLEEVVRRQMENDWLRRAIQKRASRRIGG